VFIVASHRQAQAQVVQNCQPAQYVDRTAPSADRQLNWNFGISSDPERCMQVRAGQTVVWNGDLDVHPLGGSGGDSPNPISLHQNGSVTFTAPGTYGYVCLAHSSMTGAIRVVQATAVPTNSPWATTGLAGLLLASGLLAMRHRQRLRTTPA